ncbi:redoxin domain-containing protein [bacterium]|nr:redoxin domain-containing protein [bacterium]
MKKRIIALIVLLTAAAGIAGAADTSTFRHGAPLTFSFTVPERSLTGPVNGCMLLLYKNPLSEPETYSMNLQEDGTWQTVVTVSDTAVKALFYSFELNSGGRRHGPFFPGGDYGVMLAVNADGSVAEQAWELVALSYTAAAKLERENTELALEAVNRELAAYPLNLSARQLKYSIITREAGSTDRAKKEIIKDVDLLLREYPDAEAVLNFAVETYTTTGEEDKAADLTQKIIERFPRSEKAAESRFSEIIDIEDAGDRATQLETFISDFQGTTYYEYGLTALANAVIELDDPAAMAATGEKLFSAGTTPAAAGGLAGIAGALTEISAHQEQAEAFASKAVELIESAAAMPPPPEMEEQEWQTQLAKTGARYRDILGWVQVQRGDMLTGLRNLEAASEQISEPGVYYHLGAAYERMGRSEDALTAYARAAVFDGEIGELSYNAFLTLWKNDGRSDTGAELFLDQQGDYIEQLFKRRVLAARVDRPAPNFELEDVTSGDLITLADQRGAPMVLCFWAAWSRSSQYMLKTMEEIADLYGRDVLFMTISTDSDMNRLRSYLRRYRVSFPVLINSDTDVAYGVKGVPMLYVLDKSMRIRFVHRGYRPDLTETLTVELDDLLRN